MMRIIAFQTQRGGSGKTTSCVNLAHALALMGRKVLTIDVDPQGTIRTILKISHDATIYDLLMNDYKLTEVIVPGVRDNWSAIISDKTLFQAERVMVGMVRREELLQRQLKDLSRWEFDYVLLDCPPSLSEMVHAVYFYAHEIVIPVSMDYMSFVGCQQVLETLKLLKNDFDLPLTVTGIIPLAVNPRLSMADLVTESINKVLAPYFPIFPDVRQDVAVSKSSARGMTLFDFCQKPLNKLSKEDRAVWDYYQIARLLDSSETLKSGRLTALP